MAQTPVSPEFVIVGGGPVGWWLAIQLRKRRQDCRVTVYERYDTYQRSHVLQLDHWSMLLYGRNRKSSGDALQDEFYREVTGKDLSGVAWSPTRSLFIRTNDFEVALRRYALALGVHLVTRRVERVEDVEALHPDCRHFIAADGAHSMMRAQLLGPNAVKEHPLQHVVEVKYQVKGPAARLKALPLQLAVNRKLQHMAFEYVGREREGVCPVTLRFFVSPQVYAAVPEASFKKPLAVDAPGLPAALRDDISAYMAHRNGEGGELYCQNSGNVTKLVLSLYSARRFSVERDGRSWFITGDAAMGVPYFRALNSGMILSSRLAQILCSKTWPVRGRLDRQMFFYNVHRPMHIQTEFSIARGKNFALKLFDWTRQVAGAIEAGQLSGELAAEGQELSSLAWAVDCRPKHSES